MKPEFKEWVEQVCLECNDSEDAEELIHFWLSAFARLVREEADKQIDFEEALNHICQRFGLFTPAPESHAAASAPQKDPQSR